MKVGKPQAVIRNVTYYRYVSFSLGLGARSKFDTTKKFSWLGDRKVHPQLRFSMFLSKGSRTGYPLSVFKLGSWIVLDLFHSTGIQEEHKP